MTPEMDHDIDMDQRLRRILADVLALSPAVVAGFTANTGLFGHLPALDSMAVAHLLTEMEDRLHITVEDNEVDGELLDTYGHLLAYAHTKTQAV